jgi:histidinol-phosphate/aromatic aminotransferase/cobyric acid decarboxylase-like protein
MTDPLSGPLLSYEHPDYLDEAKYATIADPKKAALDLLSIEDERGLVKTADVLRPLLRSWADDPAPLLPYPVADPRRKAELARLILDAFGGADVGDDRVFFGDGTYELFKELAGFVLRKGALLGAGPIYPEFAGYWTAAGGRFKPVLAGAEPGAFPKDELLSAIEEEPDAVAIYADLPYNATGGAPPRADLLDVVAAAERRDVVVIVDEAYANFQGRLPSYVADVATRDLLVVLRSLSKGFDLRGLRFGFVAAGARVAAALDRVRSPYAPSQPSAKAAAEILRRAPDVVAPLRDRVVAAKARVLRSAARAGVRAHPTLEATPNLMFRDDGRNLAAFFESRGARVALGAQFSRTTRGLLNRDVRIRTPLLEERLDAFDRLFEKG